MKFFQLNGPAPLFTNSYLLISENGHGVIIDPAASAEQYNRILGQEGAKLTHIFCTHGHFDHVGAAEQLRQQWGATLYCEPVDLNNGWLYPLTVSDSGYEEAQPFNVDELTFTVWHTPGHTRGSVCILCGEYLFTGDTLFAGGSGRTDMDGGSYPQLIASGKKLKRLPIPAETKVLPGHEGTSTYGYEMENNYFITVMCQD